MPADTPPDRERAREWFLSDAPVENMLVKEGAREPLLASLASLIAAVRAETLEEAAGVADQFGHDLGVAHAGGMTAETLERKWGPSWSIGSPAIAAAIRSRLKGGDDGSR
jgi:hypothetical protein